MALVVTFRQENFLNFQNFTQAKWAERLRMACFGCVHRPN